MDTMYKLEVYLPKEMLPALREVLRETDAGHIGQYDCCMSLTDVTSCWRTLPGANPYNGKVGELTVADELKAEFCCRGEILEKVVAAVRAVHPYEEPVINVFRIERAY